MKWRKCAKEHKRTCMRQRSEEKERDIYIERERGRVSVIEREGE